MTEAPGLLVLLRHGESTANAAGLFTGVLDVELTGTGRSEAYGAGAQLRDAGIAVDLLATSTMRRAVETAVIVAEVLGFTGGYVSDWRLDERNYGALTGRSKRDVLDAHGPERFRTWRRSVDVPPPPMTRQQRSRIVTEGRDGVPIPAGLGLTESLADVIERVSGFWEHDALPALRGGSTVLVVAHGNSLRALCTRIDALRAGEVESLNLPTGQPLLYRMDQRGRGVPRGGTYLDPAAALSAAADVARQGGT